METFNGIDFKVMVSVIRKGYIRKINLEDKMRENHFRKRGTK